MGILKFFATVGSLFQAFRQLMREEQELHNMLRLTCLSKHEFISLMEDMKLSLSDMRVIIDMTCETIFTFEECISIIQECKITVSDLPGFLKENEMILIHFGVGHILELSTIQ